MLQLLFSFSLLLTYLFGGVPSEFSHGTGLVFHDPEEVSFGPVPLARLALAQDDPDEGEPAASTVC